MNEEDSAMKLSPLFGVVVAIALSVSPFMTSQAAEGFDPAKVGTFEPPKCNNQGGLGVGCDVAPVLLLSMEEFNALSTASSPSKEEFASVEKVAPTGIQTFDPSKCSDQGGLGKGCFMVKPVLYLSMDQFNRINNAKKLGSAEKDSIVNLLEPQKSNN
jgi:hypothetical protein